MTTIPDFSIRHLKVSPGLVLAPMSGVTCSAFRRLIRELNPGAVGLLVSEFISVEGMTREGRRSLEMMRFAEVERPFGIQIFGYDAQRMRDAAVMVEQAGADLVDINCGCPAPKVVKRGGGCELMRQPDHLASILREVRAAVSIPVTLKMRSGWDEGSKNALQIAHIAEAEGVDALTVHGRTRSALYRGMADYEIVKQVVDAVRIPVCGSGDVRDAASASERLATGVAGLYVGRAAITNPLVFGEIVSGQSCDLRLHPELMARILLRYRDLLLERGSPPTAVVGRLKQLASQMAKQFAWSKTVCRAQTLDEQDDILAQVQHQSAQEDERTGLVAGGLGNVMD
jgi:tRNA-dihydrouridine synthase B